MVLAGINTELSFNTELTLKLKGLIPALIVLSEILIIEFGDRIGLSELISKIVTDSPTTFSSARTKLLFCMFMEEISIFKGSVSFSAIAETTRSLLFTLKIIL